MTLLQAIALASGLQATTYGHAELACGDIHAPVPCTHGAVTASGELFDPGLATVAIALPTRTRLRAADIWLRVGDGRCHRVRLNDKMNPRWIGVRGFDLTPRAVELLTGKPATRHWSGVVHVCRVGDL
jgi:hypothetical protein